MSESFYRDNSVGALTKVMRIPHLGNIYFCSKFFEIQHFIQMYNCCGGSGGKLRESLQLISYIFFFYLLFLFSIIIVIISTVIIIIVIIGINIIFVHHGLLHPNIFPCTHANTLSTTFP